MVKLFPRAEYEKAKAEGPDGEYAPQLGTPWGMKRDMLVSNLGLPCTAPPWGTLSVVDLKTGDIRWQVPVGGLPLIGQFGLPNMGGPLVTKSGLIFLAATLDSAFRAFDTETGTVLWETRLPYGGQAIPMSFQSGGRQIVIIAAGGYGRIPIPGNLGDSLVAFALPEK